MMAERRELRGLRTTVLGLGREGVDLSRFLVGRGAEVVVSDLKGPEQLRPQMEALSGLPINFVLGEHPEKILDADLLLLSPGVAPDSPIAIRARQRGIPVSNGIDMFLELCPCPVIGITGSCGKTTTTTLVGLMMKASGRTTHVGGNLGEPPLCNLSGIRQDHVAVLELSSFQLELVRRSPSVGAVLNVTPDHLNRHGSMENYLDAKFNVFRFQKPSDWAVLNFDDDLSRGLSGRIHGNLSYFSRNSEVEQGSFLRAGHIVARLGDWEGVICSVEDIRLLGPHNQENVLAATAIALAGGADPAGLVDAIRSFEGLEHRLELVRELNGVCFYNDSIATSPQRTRAALRALESPIVLIAGGKSKGLPLDELARDILYRVRWLVLLGEAADDLSTALDAARPRSSGSVLEGVGRSRDLGEAVEMAAESARSGDAVLLSPAFVSFDMFRDFEDRGVRFRDLVRSL
jgi:UDP-N-acetylmuramoylalanine--D-glutamate ligase